MKNVIEISASDATVARFLLLRGFAHHRIAGLLDMPEADVRQLDSGKVRPDVPWVTIEQDGQDFTVRSTFRKPKNTDADLRKPAKVRRVPPQTSLEAAGQGSGQGGGEG